MTESSLASVDMNKFNHDTTATHYLLLQWIQIGFTFLVLPFWYRLTRVVPDIVQKAIKRL